AGFRSGEDRSRESAASAVDLAAVASGIARSARQVLPGEQVQHAERAEADREIECVSAFVEVPGRMEGNLCSVLRTPLRAPDDGGIDSRFVGQCDEFDDAGADSGHRYPGKIRFGFVRSRRCATS